MRRENKRDGAHSRDEGIVCTRAERSAQGDVCPRIPVARGALVDEESRGAEHVVSKCEEEMRRRNHKWTDLYARAA